MHRPINVKSPNNTSKLHMGFNSAFKGLSKQPNQVGNIHIFIPFSSKHCCNGYAIMRPLCIVELYITVGPTDPTILYFTVKCKGKAIPLQAWTGPEDSRRLGSQISRQLAHEVGKVVSSMYRPPLPPGNISVSHFC
jgi:hypothetical protein